MRVMTQASHILRQILVKIRKAQAENLRALVVFDLDSTLFDVSPRIEKILLEYAEIPEFQKKFPEQIRHFKNIKTLRSDWGIRQALIRAGLDGHHPDFQQSVRDYWVKTFFSNEYLKYDKPYEGAVEFVQHLVRHGVDIVYLTGRDQHRMGKGSRETLLRWGFPLNDAQQHLVLKPHKDMDDSLFKAEWFQTWPGNNYSNIWFFENEPINVNLVKKQCPEVEIIFFHSTHSGQAEPPEDIPKIIHFLMDEEEEL